MKQLLSHPQWDAVCKVRDLLFKQNYIVWLAGGCVRDALLDVPPKDLDIVTNAPMENLLKMFPQALEVGQQFGILILPLEGGTHLEIATFRKEGTYTDGRRPDSVEVATPEEDAKRRDFTINAMFFDLASMRLIDFVRGKQDLRRRLIRTVGSARERFSEDKLRILRAFRFQSQLGFDMESEIFEAATILRFQLQQVSRERVRDEIWKLFEGKYFLKALESLGECKVFNQVFPVPDERTWVEFMGRAKELEKYISQCEGREKRAVICMLFETRLKNFLENLKLSRDEFYFYSQLQRIRVGCFAITNSIAKLRRTLGTPEGMAFYQLLKKMDASSYQIFFQNSFDPEIGFLDFETVRHTWDNAVKLGTKLPAPFVQGSDLLDLGLLPGPNLGTQLEHLYNLQLESKLSSREQAIEFIRQSILS